MAKVIKFPIPTPEKFGPQRVRKKKDTGIERHGQLNLFTGGKVIRLNKLSDFEEALILDDQGDRKTAIKLYLKAIKSGEALGDAYCNLGIIEWQDGNQTKAIDYFTLALRHDPRHFEAHYNLANLYGELGNFPLAKAHYQISIEVEPSFPNSYFNLGLTLAMNKEFIEAIRILRQYRELTTHEDQQHADELIQKLSSALS
ncbi:MAG TPA: tetratricopeptide repeat protein [Chryseolinea sp.]|nr:tetratricopeptide repeat protein [Chryseolinea sp.]